MKKLLFKIFIKILLGKKDEYRRFVTIRNKSYLLTVREYVPVDKQLEEYKKIVGLL